MFYNDYLDISTKVWKELLADDEVAKEADLNVLRLVYESKNHEISASEIALKLNMPHHVPINAQISRFSKRVVAKTGVQPPLREDGTPRWWHVPFLGYENGGRFPWIMRPQLVIAFEDLSGLSESELIYSGEVTVEESATLPEGSGIPVFVNRYERNRRARSKCIAYYGSRCIICGFDFGKVYGPIGKDKIHVHHIVPLSDRKQEYGVDPILDLVPVCPNCHLIIHSKQESFTIEDVKEMINTFKLSCP